MAQAHSFGYWLRLKRQSLSLSRKAFAEMVSYSVATIRKIEAEERRPSPQLIDRLADVLSVPVEEHQAFKRFARGEMDLTTELPGQQPPWRAQTTRSHLPTPATSLIGRQSEIAAVRDYLMDDAVRLVTLIGPPGIGKTRLSLASARAVAGNFPDGVFFVDLAPLDDATLIETTIEKALGFVESRDNRAGAQLSGKIGHKRLLIVLDNCEHLIDAIASLVAELLRDSAGPKIVATSRESLRVPGEWLYSVPALGLPEQSTAAGQFPTIEDYPALALFNERARAVNAGFRPDKEMLPAIVAICTRLDGLPLAIELLAASMRLMTPQELLDRMSDSFVLSADGMRGVPARQKTLHKAINWSYDALSPSEQRLFGGLSVFTGGFTLASASGVFSESITDRSITDLVMALLDKSLIERIEELSNTRFSMLVTIRQFAHEALRRIGDGSQVRDQHLAYFIELAEQVEPYLHGPDQKKWGDLLQAEIDNFRAALNWSLEQQYAEPALRLLAALCWPWSVQAHYGETCHYLEAVRKFPDIVHYPVPYARILAHAGRNSWIQDDPEDAVALLEESRAILSKAGPEAAVYLAETLNWIGLVAQYPTGDIEAAKSLFAGALEISETFQSPWVFALSTFHLGIAAIFAQDYSAALVHLEQSLALFRRLGDLFFIARVQAFLGQLFIAQEMYDRALTYIEEQLRIDSEINHWDGIADGYFGKGSVLLVQGDEAQSAYYFKISDRICDEHGLGYRKRPS